MRKGNPMTVNAIGLTLDKAMMAKLEELADYHGESTEDTLRVLIRYAYSDMRRFVEEEFGKSGEKVPPPGPQADDEIPI